jgi:hypothetical protein
MPDEVGPFHYSCSTQHQLLTLHFGPGWKLSFELLVICFENQLDSFGKILSRFFNGITLGIGAREFGDVADVTAFFNLFENCR